MKGRNFESKEFPISEFRAALDVIEVEPPPKEHLLLQLDNVLWTPHLGGVTFEAFHRSEWDAAGEIIRVLEGKRPKKPVTLVD